jgi:3-carboxy-cis,cis-muconate cycloisomerase
VVIPLVKDLLAAAPDDLTPAIHLGATSQDIVDTAQQLVLRDALEETAADLRAARDRAAGLAREHAETPRVGRTLGQVAVPTSFGLTAATWAVGLHRAALACDRARDDLAIQLAGAAGTASVHGTRWPDVAAALARRLSLRVPEAPWHTERSRIRGAAAALADAVAAAAKIGTDVAALAVTEVGELAEAGAGGSSAMPHKRNPVRAVLLRAAGIRAPGLLGTVYSASLQENERAVGGWHAEWQPVADLVRLGRGSADRVRDLLENLRVNADAMRRNLDAARPFVMSEAAATALAGRLGRAGAQAAVTRALRAGGEAPTDASVRAALRSDVGDCPELDDPSLLDPASALAAVPGLIDRALSSCRETA